VPHYAAGWAGRDGCAAKARRTRPRPRVLHLIWRGCDDGLRVEVLRLSGTEHSWPGAAPPFPGHSPSGISATAELLRFVRGARRP
jgi:polyhydroxybutyrate depolymerase